MLSLIQLDVYLISRIIITIIVIIIITIIIIIVISLALDTARSTEVWDGLKPFSPLKALLLLAVVLEAGCLVWDLRASWRKRGLGI